MEQNVLIRSMEIGGRTLTLETGKVARQAGGSVLARYGDTVILVAATASKEPREGIDFFPLTVDYEERMYAVGKIPGGFIKREGRPSTDSILAARLTDRPIRPLFPKGYRNDVQVVSTVFSVDHNSPPAITSMVGASAALTLSEIPFMGPIGSVVVGRVNGELIINPSAAQEEAGDLNLIVSGTAEAVMMVEAGAKEVPEDVVLEAIMFGHEQIKKIVEFINKFREEALALGLAKEKKEPSIMEIPAEIDGAVREQAIPRITQALDQCIKEKWDKKYREDYFKKLKEEISSEFVETFPDDIKVVRQVLEKVEKEQIRKRVLETGDRLDGRKTDEVRPIWCETGVLPRTHGSGLFTRGQTQVMTITTLGPVGDEQILDGLGLEESKRYMHHYNFPSFSVGETRPNRGPGRREIGHGMLAERALLPMIPSVEEFPYALRLVSEVLESNGSSSMGSVCGSTLSLMDAGVPIKAPVAGVAMGLMKEADKIAILTDIQGAEDHLGDMDFKVAGTKKGVTALQMDIKIGGVTKEILKTALEQAYHGRMHILGKMLEVLPEPKKEMSPYAPRIIIHKIDPDKIRTVIGPGGKMIKKIIDETGVKIDIEDDGKVYIAAIDPEAGKRALKIIMDLTEDVEVGKIYLGKVMRIMDFGAFVEVLPGKEGLVHISHLADHRVAKVEDVVSLGEQILVKVLKIDEQGRVNLSRKEAIKAEQAAKEE